MSNVTPKFVNRIAVNGTSYFASMPTERIIAYVQSVYPNAKLIPNSPTYNRAVSEYNIVVRMGMDRPPIPKWFCGYVNESNGELGKTDTATPVGNSVPSRIGEDLGEEEMVPSAYAWDECLIVSGDETRGCGWSPGTVGYVNCFSDSESASSALVLDSSFWDDFIIEYDEEARAAAMAAAGMGGSVGMCASKEALKDLVIRRSGISETDRTSPVTCWICGQERANRGDLCEHVCKSHSDDPEVASAGGGFGEGAELCSGVGGGVASAGGNGIESYSGDGTGSGAAQIGNLRVNKNGLSFSWISGSCESLGPTKGKSDAACHARLWVKIGGSWSGGKFDWISTSRTSRDFKNIYSGYNGWSSSMLSKASEFGFDIYHPGTKKKTNRATCPGWH